MNVAENSIELQKLIAAHGNNKSVGFVPTMGALHNGHISLVQRAAAENDITIVSIFVNPTQFNNAEDLKKYPRDLNADLLKLTGSGCQIVFAPTVNEMYPEPDIRKFDFGHLETVMEGKHRPGHFNGVAQVVSKLFQMVKPSKAYFGLKDFQQLAIINALVKKLKINTEIIPCEIIRHADGLAMSSRNVLLTNEERVNATVIYKTIFDASNNYQSKSVQETINHVVSTINKNKFLNVEYFEIVDGIELQAIKSWDVPGKIIGCIAVFCGKVRLIDNINFN